ncbi:MAG: RNA-directed DNA polymerase [Candidatus Moranbacteria bacterium]|nr:RNA-directed DNA polymerase [Candidatus Moranbacteria bacterium]
MTHRIERERESTEARQKGIPIGNLTSQIFANIYLNELDRFVKHVLKPKVYLRYGDDFFIITDDRETAVAFRERITLFLLRELRLEINPKHDILIPVKKGLRFLGVEIFPGGRRMNKRNRKRIIRNLDRKNIASYRGLVAKHEKKKRIKFFDWTVLDRYDEF